MTRITEPWIAGFWAASLLFDGRYTDYAAERDKFLTATQRDNQVSDLPKQLLEVAQIAEAHFMKTFGTDRIAAVREAAKLLAEAREALEPFAQVAPFFEQRYCAGDLVTDLSRQGEHAQLTVGDIRKARAVLAKLKAATEPAA